MTTLREAAQMALDAVETYSPEYMHGTPKRAYIKAIRAALAQPEQEPVAWADKHDIEREGHDFYANRQQPAKNGVPLYTTPPQRDWQGLTDEEIEKLVYDIRSQTTGVVATAYVARAIEAKLKEKNDY